VNEEDKMEVRERIWFHWAHGQCWKFNSTRTINCSIQLYFQGF